ncbi:MAG TPA: metal-sensitive transcriptional regulator [Candidatus Moranbacteria bacterium]|nr:metal-sensitive transcriptional regulator [Candidatus Moranbacteria bacterium]
MPKKKNNAEPKEQVLNRIARIEGQLRGVRRMIEQEDQCIDIMTQIMAVREAISKLGIELLKNDFVCKLDKKNTVNEAYLKTLFRMK